MKKILISSVVMTLIASSVIAKDTMGLEFSINSISFDSEKIKVDNPIEEQEKISAVNGALKFYALFDITGDETWFVGPFLSASVSKHNEEDLNAYDKTTDYAPIDFGLMGRYELSNTQNLKKIGFKFSGGITQMKIGDRDSSGYNGELGAYFKITEHFNMGIQAGYRYLTYKKQFTEINPNVISGGIFLGYDVF